MKVFKSIRMVALASALGGLAAFTLVACGGGGSSSSTASSTSATAQRTLDVKLGDMTVEAPKSIPAGPTKVTVVNQDPKGVEHEAVFLRTDTPAAKVPVDKKTGEASEKDSDGEVADLAQGQSGSTTINFKPGHYAIVCNVPGHYTAGMYADMEVTKG